MKIYIQTHHHTVTQHSLSTMQFIRTLSMKSISKTKTDSTSRKHRTMPSRTKSDTDGMTHQQALAYENKMEERKQKSAQKEADKKLKKEQKELERKEKAAKKNSLWSKGLKALF